MKKINFLTLIMLLVSLAGYAQWSLTGNAGTNLGTNFVGTTDNKAVVFKTDNKERMRIKTNGFVGIGTNTPQYKLDVTGDINLSGTIKNLEVQFCIPNQHSEIFFWDTLLER